MTPTAILPETAASPADLARDVERHLEQTLARTPGHAGERDVYWAVALAVRDRLAARWAETTERHRQGRARRVYYLSLEFLIGRTLGNALLNLELEEEFAEAARLLGHRLEALEEAEPDAGLGNGGLGRLAACYLDSMATLGVAGYGYGIRYEHGIFRQAIVDGRQVEQPDSWLRDGNPWEIARPDRTYPVCFYGRVEPWRDETGRLHYRWTETRDVRATAYDLPVPGYGAETVNTLRLWSAQATEEFDLEDFLRGDYVGAVHAKMESETISKVLYPPDDTGAGKELRLKQQFFFVSATLQDVLRRHAEEGEPVGTLPERAQIQLNDTHPTLAVPELMRLLMDEHALEWDEAWEIVHATCAYTNHTVLPEALERWSEELLERLLPRHMQIVREIDRRHRAAVAARFPGDPSRVERMAIVSGGEVRMANLALVGTHATNGVAELHAEILRKEIFRDFEEMEPGRIRAVTNGVTPRRWIRRANPGLSALITERIGEGWLTDLERLEALEPAADDPAFREAFRRIRRENKARLASVVRRECDVELDPDAIFDVHVKRIHEYKRQLLNALRLVDDYLTLRDDPDADRAPRAVLFAGKAAPTYRVAKDVIHLIARAADLVNRDPRVNRTLRAAFLPNYRVSLAQRIIPATDLSEQISTAGYEASGTGNMKFALNGALTIGTLDGANVEIVERVGRENAFIFGLTAAEVAAEKAAGYRPRAYVERSERLRAVLDFVASGELSPEEPGRFRPLVDALVHHDPFLVCADFDAYLAAQAEVDRAWRDPEGWTRAAVLNVARCGWFSSDRSVRDYCGTIWGVPVDR